MTADSIKDIVLFPPRPLVDFLIHYDGADFHVHKLVLYRHSAYFRTYFDTLDAVATAQPTVALRILRADSPAQAPLSDSGSPVSKKAKLCNHPHIAHCIHMPQQTRLVEQ